MKLYKRDWAYREVWMQQALARRLVREKRNVDSRRAARAADPNAAALDQLHRLIKKISE